MNKILVCIQTASGKKVYVESNINEPILDLLLLLKKQDIISDVQRYQISYDNVPIDPMLTLHDLEMGPPLNHYEIRLTDTGKPTIMKGKAAGKPQSQTMIKKQDVTQKDSISYISSPDSSSPSAPKRKMPKILRKKKVEYQETITLLLLHIIYVSEEPTMINISKYPDLPQKTLIDAVLNQIEIDQSKYDFQIYGEKIDCSKTLRKLYSEYQGVNGELSVLIKDNEAD